MLTAKEKGTTTATRIKVNSISCHSNFIKPIPVAPECLWILWCPPQTRRRTGSLPVFPSLQAADLLVTCGSFI